jgi:flagellar assembly protein FliH
MSSTRKFQFDVSFDGVAQDGKGGIAPSPTEPRHSAKELAAARERAFAEGRAAGEAAARATIDHATAQALARIAEHAGVLLQAQAASDQRNTHAAVEVAAAMVRKLYPELARRSGLVEIEGALAHALETMRTEPRIVVRVCDALLDPLRDRLESITAATGYEGRVVLIADGAIAAGDCRVEWADGGVERDTGRLWREIQAALDRNTVATTEPTHQ